MRFKPYIGITGLMSQHEIRKITEGLHYPLIRAVMVGVLASSKTLSGLINKYPRQFPRIRELREVFPPRHPWSVNLVHFSTDEPDLLSEQMFAIDMLCKDSHDGFQLNVAWPSPEELEKYRDVRPEANIVLQIGAQAMGLAQHRPKALADRLVPYRDLIDGILIDPSGGFGKPFDLERSRRYLGAVAERDLGISLGIAGGLGPDSLDRVEPLVSEFKGLSIDAQGRLRTERDDLDVGAAREYLHKALAMFERYEQLKLQS